MNIKIGKRTSLYIAAVACALLASVLSLLSAQPTYAQEGNSSDGVVVYCMSEVPKGRAFCEKASTWTRNVATYKCDSNPNKPNSYANCVERKAKEFIEEAAKKNPSSANDFEKELDKILDEAGGNRNKPKNESTQNLPPDTSGSNFFGSKGGTHQCGKGEDAFKTKFNFGCLGNSYTGGDQLNPIFDLIFALIRFLSAGVGIVVIIAIILAGIQYSSSEGNPEATQQAKNGIQNAIAGLILYIFAFSLIQFLVPGGLFTS